MLRMRRTVAVAAVAALAFSGCVGAQEGPILIGASIPLTVPRQPPGGHV